MKLAGKLAVVTGASRLEGIGAAICLELAKNGCDLFFTYWTAYDREMPWGVEADEPEALLFKLREFGVKAEAMEMDLSQKEAPALLMETVIRKMGPPDILVNNAAYSTSGPFTELTADIWDRHYEVNVRGTALLCSEFAKAFKKGSGGRIINLSSGQFQGAMPGELAYAATKGAVEAMTITLAAEAAPLGITVNAINPGPTDTGWMDDRLKVYLQERFPFGRIGKPEDAAKLVQFLAGRDADWITGQIIHSEGGFMR
ncbi:3-oxoacyl-[acyl-carrier-protein] reductase FabG [Planococcus massiliensis]|uniref:3-oxoacyl-[acyl-carrier-protein] reductase FabG n=1 Tax=Planococcus massiliensis TaxID=1499687 RepID=A0A098EK83_9BACL|nr:SDR family oxidoreductase [Planococcus massiliensis]CEG22764.1 3-oxoacyl-[acyl-carrier-protein] reductase FabG [Planococcus massiliensis]